MNEQVTLFKDAMAALEAHAARLVAVALIVEGRDPWPTDLARWILPQATTTDGVTLAAAFRDAARDAARKAGFIAVFLRDANVIDALLLVVRAGSSIDLLLEHRVGLGGAGCATLPSATEAMADITARADRLFPPHETILRTPEIIAFTRWLEEHPQRWV